MFLFKQACDTHAKLAAFNRAQAIVEFDLYGTILTANANFLAAVGYSLPEIVGRHHSLFVDPEHAASEEYRAFWAQLRAGEFQASQYRRLAKGGREIWIEASYSRDSSGRLGLGCRDQAEPSRPRRGMVRPHRVLQAEQGPHGRLGHDAKGSAGDAQRT